MVSIDRTTRTGLLALAALAGAVLSAGAWQHGPSAATPQAGQLKLDAHRTLGKPRVFRNLTLIPVYDAAARPTDSYLTLDEGLKLKQVSVKEAKEGGDVNTLYVTNASKKPLYLMGGEVVLGGQQDRTLGRDTIVPPGSKAVPVTVFCVEHGRWTGRSEFDQSAPTVASAQIRASAQNGEFYAAREAAAAPPALAGQAAADPSNAAPLAMGNVRPLASGARIQSRSGRINSAAANGTYGDVTARAGRSNHVSDAQQKVWDSVARKNAKLKTESSTGSYRRALTLAGGDALKSVPAYVTALAGSLGSDPHLVGVVAAVNGKVVAADTFGEPALFQKLWPKLLRSYASDAVESASEDTKKIAAATAGQAKDFLITATDAKSKIENKSDVGSTVRYESSQAVTFSLVPKPPAGGGVGRAGKYGGAPVHTGVLGK